MRARQDAGEFGMRGLAIAVARDCLNLVVKKDRLITMCEPLKIQQDR
jgi:hypothetical protein